MVNPPAQFGKLGTYWIMQPGATQLLITLWSFIFADLPVTSALALTISTITLTLLLVFLAYRALDTIRHQRPDCKPLQFSLWLAFAPIALMWLFSQWRPVYLTRALLPSGLMFYVALAWLLTRSRLPRFVLAVIDMPWLATILIGLYLHYTWPTFPRAPFHTADQYIPAPCES